MEGPSLHDSLCKFGTQETHYGAHACNAIWASLNPFSSVNFQDAQDELCGDRRCDTFEMGFIPTAFIIFYFAVTGIEALQI